MGNPVIHTGVAVLLLWGIFAICGSESAAMPTPTAKGLPDPTPTPTPPPSSSGCDGVCCKMATYTWDITSTYKLNIFNMVVADCLLIMMMFFLVKLHSSYIRIEKQSRLQEDNDQEEEEEGWMFGFSAFWTMNKNDPDETKKRNATPTVLPFYYVYALFACFVFLLQAIAIFFPENKMTQVLEMLLYELHTMLDNGIWVFAFFESVSKVAICGTILITLLFTMIKLIPSLSYVLITEGPKLPNLFYPSDKFFYVFIFLAIFYALLLALSYWEKIRIRPRKTVRVWITYLLIIFSLSSLGAGIDLFSDSSFGYCIINLDIILYNSLYAPIMYYTFIIDSKFLHMPPTEAINLIDTTSQEYTRIDVVEIAKATMRDFPSINWIDIHKIKKGVRCGAGAYGVVYKGWWNGTAVAVKRIHHEKAPALRPFFREISIMGKLSHPHIVLFMGVSVDNNNDRYIITEFLDGGSVFDLLHKKRKKNSSAIGKLYNVLNLSDFQGENIKKVMLHAARGMAYLHSLDPPIIHRDLKSHNILMDDKWNAKIADFGLSRPAVEHTMTAAGTPQWTAPEVIRQEHYGPPADVYSFGIVLYEVFSHCIPYQGVSPYEAAHGVAFRGNRPVMPKHMPLEWADLAITCLNENPLDRPKFTDIISRLEDLAPPPPFIIPSDSVDED